MRLQVLVAMGVVFLSTWVGLGATGAFGVAELSAQQILAKTAENYRGATGYAFRGDVRTRMTLPTQVQEFTNALLVAYGGPGRARFEASTSGDLTLFVLHGDSSYTYSSTLAQYAVLPVKEPSLGAGVPAIDPGASHPFAPYARIAEHLASAELVGRDTATVNGKVVPTYVIDARYDSTLLSVQEGMKYGPKRFSIDAERFLVVGDRSTVERSHPALPKPITIEQQATFTDVQWNTQEPDSLFAFAAPAGAARVAQIGQSGGDEEQDSPFTGKPAIDFTLADLKGVKRTLSSHKGKVVLLDFWATWCGPCRREMPIVAKMHAKYASKGLVVYGVNCSESTAKAQAFVDKYGYKLPILLDKDGTVQGRYSITAIPTVFVIDRKGVVSAHMIGGRSEDDLLAALQKAGLDTGP